MGASANRDRRVLEALLTEGQFLSAAGVAVLFMVIFGYLLHRKQLQLRGQELLEEDDRRTWRR